MVVGLGLQQEAGHAHLDLHQVTGVTRDGSLRSTQREQSCAALISGIRARKRLLISQLSVFLLEAAQTSSCPALTRDRDTVLRAETRT